MKLSETQRKVLAVLVAYEDNYLSFAAINACMDSAVDRMNMDRTEIRRACRALRSGGLAEFGSGLFTEDGETYGSGYMASAAGRAALGGDDAKAE